MLKKLIKGTALKKGRYCILFRLIILESIDYPWNVLDALPAYDDGISLYLLLLID